MWCRVKYTTNHTYMKSQLYQLLMDEGDSGLPNSEEFVDCVESIDELPKKEGDGNLKTVISLHALLGTGDSQTMRVKDHIKQQPIIILVDSGSTHNFINQSVVKKLAWPTQFITGIGVFVANGE